MVAPLKLFAFAILMLASVAVNAMSVPLIPVISVRLIADNRSETPPLRRSTLVKLITAFALKPSPVSLISVWKVINSATLPLPPAPSMFSAETLIVEIPDLLPKLSSAAIKALSSVKVPDSVVTSVRFIVPLVLASKVARSAALTLVSVKVTVKALISPPSFPVSAFIPLPPIQSARASTAIVAVTFPVVAPLKLFASVIVMLASPAV